MELYAGVDGGGTKTQAVVVDRDGVELGRAISGGANYQAIGVDKAVEHITAALRAAAQQAGADPYAPISAAWVGLAGIDRPADRDMLLPRLTPLAGTLRLTNDAELGLAALRGGFGITLIAGTGSIALGKDAHGNAARAGGWGHIIGDEGSGYGLGRQALQAAAQAADGRGTATTLLPRIVEFWSLRDPSEIIGKVYPEGDKALIAGLSSVVFAAARDGDAVATKLVQGATLDLTRLVLAVAEKLNFDHTLSLALVGGVVTRNENMRLSVLRRLRRHYTLGQVALVHEPSVVAAQAAIRLLEPA